MPFEKARAHEIADASRRVSWHSSHPCEDEGRMLHAHFPGAILGLGLCQWPLGAMSASATFGPQLWRL
jgi:hypothetical protein